VLIVEDDRLSARVLSGILQSEGYQLAEAGSGERALNLYEEFRPHLVLLDVILPGMDGFETCRRLKQAFGEKSAPVIFITAKSQSDDVVEGLTAGGVDYLPKPFKSNEVLARIRVHLHNQLLSEQQQALVEQLSKVNAAKNKFLGMAAHDLRNPLASIRGITEFLSDGAVGPLSSEQRELIETIRNASHSMLDLVNELLDLTAIEAGELKLRFEAHRFDELVAKCVAMSTRESTKKQTRVIFEAPQPTKLIADSAKMKQVIDNLLSNAVKFSPPGSTVRVTVQPDASRNLCTFCVCDEGPGIPENERDKLFKDFSRLSIQPTGGEKSTGLGLAICRKIVEAHHGAIVAENLPGKGCQFRVTLPLVR
jgi:signal transduction histidine kinase